MPFHFCGEPCWGNIFKIASVIYLLRHIAVRHRVDEPSSPVSVLSTLGRSYAFYRARVAVAVAGKYLLTSSPSHILNLIYVSLSLMIIKK